MAAPPQATLDVNSDWPTLLSPLASTPGFSTPQFQCHLVFSLLMYLGLSVREFLFVLFESSIPVVKQRVGIFMVSYQGQGFGPERILKHPVSALSRRHKEVDVGQDLRLLTEMMLDAKLHPLMPNRPIYAPLKVNKKGDVAAGPRHSAIIDWFDTRAQILHGGKFNKFIRSTTWDPAARYPKRNKAPERGFKRWDKILRGSFGSVRLNVKEENLDKIFRSARVEMAPVWVTNDIWQGFEEGTEPDRSTSVSRGLGSKDRKTNLMVEDRGIRGHMAEMPDLKAREVMEREAGLNSG
ncbi:hypothetical protein DFH09DRAFT_1103341 [Mycena vulgaris]|nr:hypothetical protein DFH09DRAFT_1103341 [Mycena vulgaris]